MSWFPIYKPNCMPTLPIPVGNGFKQAVPTIQDLHRVYGSQEQVGTGERMVNAYEVVCQQLAQSRLHLAKMLVALGGKGVPEDPAEAIAQAIAVGAALVFLGGDPGEALRIAEANTIEAAKLP